jgi:hypothetical protein
MNHDPVTVAHPGRSRTLDILFLRFYWPGMRRHVEEYMRNCQACQRLEPRLENLKSKLRTAYKLARDHSRKSHAANKRYYDRGSKEREFAVGDFVYLYNAAVKVGVSAKFRRPWVGPWRITEKRSRLNYVITDQRGKQMVVHVN